jgi:hypothetical protein
LQLARIYLFIYQVQSSIGIVGYTSFVAVFKLLLLSITIIEGLIPTFLNSRRAYLYNSVDSFGRKAKPIENNFPELVILYKS